ncbi:MAG: aminotransferase class IV, partial [Terriglobales bacterium]
MTPDLGRTEALAAERPHSFAKDANEWGTRQLIKMEAIINGYAEGIALDVNGYVSEGSGENLFVIRNGVLQTAP